MKQKSYKNDKDLSFVNPSNTFIQVNSKDWIKPGILSIEKIGDILQIKMNEDLSHMNVTSVIFEKQNEFPEIPPESIPIDTKTHLAVDSNYLYVWVPQDERWKRIPLSIW